MKLIVLGVDSGTMVMWPVVRDSVADEGSAAVVDTVVELRTAAGSVRPKCLKEHLILYIWWVSLHYPILVICWQLTLDRSFSRIQF